MVPRRNRAAVLLIILLAAHNIATVSAWWRKNKKKSPRRSPEKVGAGGRSATAEASNLVDAERQVCRIEDPGAFDAAKKDVAESIQTADEIDDDDVLSVNTVDDVRSAMADFAPSDEARGWRAWKFLSGLAKSETFVREYWHKRPLLLRSADTGGWAKDCFTIKKDLSLIDGSYITGHKTAEILRNGTKTDTWALSPLKDDPARKTTWEDVRSALDGGTIYFNTAGSLWPTLGGLTRMTSYAFGLPPNVNVYVTPAGLTVSVPPHTDKQDVLVMQSEGYKRWRVYAPPARSSSADPLGRGKAGDVLTPEELGEPLLDVVLAPGDILYVPTGFPHTTDTSTRVDDSQNDGDMFSGPSLHLTMGLDTHVWCLSMAHVRWSLLQRCGLNFNLNISDDEVYWSAMESIPLGFLGGQSWLETVSNMKQQAEERKNDGENQNVVAGDNRGVLSVSKSFKSLVRDRLLATLNQLEPDRWHSEGTVPSSQATPNDTFPSNDKIDEVVEFFVASHWSSLMSTQEELFKNIDPSSENSLIKAFDGTQKQNLLMEKFGEFSQSKAFAESYRQRRLAAEQKTRGLM